MFNQLIILVLCLAIHFRTISAVRMAEFIPPENFILEKEFTAGCILYGLNASNTHQYTVNFYFNSRVWFNDLPVGIESDKTAVIVGFWAGEPGCTTCSPKFSTTNNFSKIRLKSVAACNADTYPEFEIKMTPFNGKAYGTYFCSVKVATTENDLDLIEYKGWGRFSVYNSHFGLVPSMMMMMMATTFAVATTFQLRTI